MNVRLTIKEDHLVAISTPNLDKMMANNDWSQQLGGFLDWLLNTKNLQICKYSHEDAGGAPLFVPEYRSVNQWLADYLDIDLEEMDRERMRVLAAVRMQNTIRDLEEPIE
jgi:hypothetical protein